MTVRAAEGGVPIVLTAPLTEIIDHAGYFIQMSMASLPIWLEGIINKKYPKWRDVEYNADGAPTPRAQSILGHTPMGRFGDAHELVGAAVFLASPRAASFVTGIDLRVDGGFLSQTI